MKPDQILDAIGEVEEELIQKAKEKKKTKKSLWITMGSLAAGIALLFTIPNIISFAPYETSEAPMLQSGSSTSVGPGDGSEIAIAEENVWIYYVGDGQILCDQEFLTCTAETIFYAWKQKNGIGDEVKLIDFRIDSNANTTILESKGEEITKHEVGNHFILNVTVSANIAAYYNTIDEKLLLESLKQTMTGYSEIKFNEYHLMLQ